MAKNNDHYNPISVQTVHEEMMENDTDYRAAHMRNAPKYALIEAMQAARAEAGMSLEQIATQMGTTKSALSRTLTGNQTPSWNTVMRFATALGKEPVVQFIDSDS